MSRRKKLIEVTGKEETFEPTRLDQILGEFNEFALYGTKNEEEYKQQIFGMSRADLEVHAIKLGLVPVEGVERLRDILLKEFRSYNSSLYKPTHKDPTPDTIPDNIKKILAEQR